MSIVTAKPQLKLCNYRQGQQGFDGVIAFLERISREMKWQCGDQIKAYPVNSVLLALENHDGTIGGIHIVRGNANEGMPILTVWPELKPENITEYADIALLAIGPAYRGDALAPWLLIAEAWRYGKEQHLLKVWGEVPVSHLPTYNRLGWPWKQIGPERLHWGEPCYPCMIDLDELENNLVRRAKTSALHKEVLASMYR